MTKQIPITRRGFFQVGAALALAQVAGGVAVPRAAHAKAGAYATLIDLSRCDGCRGEVRPKCVEACRLKNKERFPEPVKPIRDLWPHKKHDDWSDRRDVIDRLTPYNWLTVQRIPREGGELFIPRRCMHCDNAPCANLCPFGALNKFRSSAVVINHDLCMGGAKCRAVCPWEIPQRQSGVGIYLKIQPLPAGGGVMYKCDLCPDLIARGEQPACIAACEKRLGANRPLFFGTTGEIAKQAARRAAEINGHIYGQKENGGTATIYVSPLPFEEITARLREAKTAPLMPAVKPRLEETNRWAGGFILGPLLAAVGAVGLVFKERARKNKEQSDG